MYSTFVPYRRDSQPTSADSNGTLEGPGILGDLVSPYYGYLPTEWTGILFVVLFFITAVSHLAQASLYRKWWLLPTAFLASCGEVLGWACRVWSSTRPLEIDPYLIQTIALVVSPTFLIGALFITFGQLSAQLGSQYSRLSPRLYARIFFTSDFVALLVQSVGGGIAASSRKPETIQLGSHVILAGVSFQLASLTVFFALLVEYIMRHSKEQPRIRPCDDSLSDSVTVIEPPARHALHSTKAVMAGLCMETALLYIRAVYRTIELASGWGGNIMRTQTLFVVFDGVTVLLATLTLNVCHPGRILSNGPVDTLKEPVPHAIP